jgi:hypothetical protein
MLRNTVADNPVFHINDPASKRCSQHRSK